MSRTTCQNVQLSTAYGFYNLYRRLQQESTRPRTSITRFSRQQRSKKFYVTQQSPTEGIDEYYNRFENAKDLVGLFNADIVDLTLLLAEERKINWSIMNTNKAKYELLWNKLENDLLVGQDSYPETIGDATHLLTNWKASTSPPPATNDHSRRTPGAPPAITFAGGETRRPGESTVRGTCTDPVPLPANDDFSALTGFDPTHPLAPSKKHPYNISADIECVKCKKRDIMQQLVRSSLQPLFSNIVNSCAHLFN